jgi:hypothetical protein
MLMQEANKIKRNWWRQNYEIYAICLIFLKTKISPNRNFLTKRNPKAGGRSKRINKQPKNMEGWGISFSYLENTNQSNKASLNMH